jgi:hypothetical protein
MDGWRSPGWKFRRCLIQPPVTASPGSRFGLLGEVSEDGGEASVAEEVAWQGLTDESRVLSIKRHVGQVNGELLADFLAKIGYPTPESRPWEREVPSSPEADRALGSGARGHGRRHRRGQRRCLAVEGRQRPRRLVCSCPNLPPRLKAW